ncbi:MAG: hypothetical protein EOS81_01230 [Mesorhizobium sp.]|nr:MAG: hypothetical protein EOS81_01230 [Mesorhizobium sp.]
MGKHRDDVGQAGDRRITDVLVAGDYDALACLAQKQQSLLEAGLEAGQEGDVGGVLAVGIDNQPVGAGLVDGAGAARFICRGRDGGALDRKAEIRDIHVAQGDGHFCPR